MHPSMLLVTSQSLHLTVSQLGSLRLDTPNINIDLIKPSHYAPSLIASTRKSEHILPAIDNVLAEIVVRPQLLHRGCTGFCEGYG